jgi:hypothetical protein
MTTNHRTDAAAERKTNEENAHIASSSDISEALLRQVVALRVTSAADDQLTQLIRIVDSATWSAPVPMTVLVDGALLRGVLVPSEVSATFLDDVLRRSAHAAVDDLEGTEDEGQLSKEEGSGDRQATASALQRARAFLRRVRRRPFSNLQAGVRQRNANALMALNDWHERRDHGTRLTALDFPGSYTDPASVVRDVLPYAAGQRALTLADVRIMVAGEWLAFTAPIRVTIGRIGAWTVDL